MKKIRMYSESAYVIGLFALALGVALMERADFGVSMVVAPAYVVYLKLSASLSWFSFGMAEYTLQAVLLVVMMLVMRRFRWSYLFSFVTAFVYGLILDGFMLLTSSLVGAAFGIRLALYVAGVLLCAVGVANMFHTYIAPEVYELFVKEVSAKFHVEIGRFKTGYDCVSCLVGVALSFAFFGFGQFEGVRAGTILCALINGSIIGLFSRMLDKHVEFRPLIGQSAPQEM